MSLGAVVVMGVSGAGKSAVGSALAVRLGVPFRDADELHTEAARAKMAAGTPLTDADRAPWLDRVGAVANVEGDLVIACSALRRVYRDRLRAACSGMRVLELEVPRAELERRLRSRRGHFMPASLLDSQLATLEGLQPDEAGARITTEGGIDATVERARFALSS